MKLVPFFSLLIMNLRVNAQAIDTFTADYFMIIQNYEKAYQLYANNYTNDSLNYRLGLFTINAAILSGKTNQAKTLLEKLIPTTTDSLSWMPYMARIYDLEGNVAQCIKSYRFITRKDSTNITYLKRLALVYKNNDLNKDAIDTYKKILNLQNEDLNALTSLTDLYMNNDLDSLASIYLFKALEIDSSNISTRKLAARISYNKKDYVNTIKHLEFVQTSVDFSPYLHNIIGISYMNLDSLSKASYHIQKSLSHREYKEYGYYYLATIEEKLGNFDKAHQYYDNAIHEGISKFADIYYKRKGQLYVEKNDFQNAVAAFKKAYELCNKPDYIYFLAQCFDLDMNVAEAKVYYNNYLNLTNKEGKYKDLSVERIKYLEGL